MSLLFGHRGNVDYAFGRDNDVVYYTIVNAEHFGAGSDSAVAQVPEPPTAILAMSIFTIVIGVAQKNRRTAVRRLQ